MERSRITGLLVASSLTFALAACGGSTEADGEDAAGGTTKVIVGTSNDAPLSYLDADGTLTGIDGDILMAIADINDWEVEVQVTEFATLIESLKSNRIDIIADAMTITDERAKQAAFSEVWYYLNDAIVVPESDTTTMTYDDIAGEKLGTVTGTLYADYLTELSGDKVSLFDSQATMLAALENGEIAGAITDAPVASFSIAQNPDLKVRVVNPPEPHFTLNIGSAVRTGDTEMLDAVNSALVELKGNGTYDEILAKYEMPASAVAE